MIPRGETYPMNLTDFSVSEQITFFKSAAIIVAPHGAGLTNLMFCDSNQIVFELLSHNYLNPCFKAIAEGNNLRYRALINPIISKSNDKHYDKMVVDIDLLQSKFRDDGIL